MPIVLAAIPLSAQVPGAVRLFEAVFVLVLVFTLVQAGMLAPVAGVHVDGSRLPLGASVTLVLRSGTGSCLARAPG